jgi:hypothetical protein
MLLLLVGAWPAAAQETTGAIAGIVKDTDGGVLPGVTVQAIGPVGTIDTISDARGEYRFPLLPPGRYTVRASLSAFRPSESMITLAVGTTARVEFTLALATLSETVNVTAITSAVDITNSATATNITRERLEFVPRGRDFTDVVAQAAGAADESKAGGISIDGSSGSENRFIIDGVNTTSPQVGTNAVPMRADFMEEVQVKSAGYAAEFGGSTGGVINAITRSGSNAFSGGLFMDYESRSWGGAERPLLRQSLTSDTFTYITPRKDDETRIDPGFSIGGPILRDRLWFFGAYQPGIRNTERTVTFSNGVTNTFDSDFRVNYGAVNVTGNLGRGILFRMGANLSPYETKRSLPPQDGRTSLTTAESYLRGTKGDRQTFSGSVDYVPTRNVAISLRAGRFLTDVQSTGVEFPSLIHNFSTASTAAGIASLPTQFREQPGFLSDVLVTNATARDEYIRDHLSADATFFVQAAGDHQIKVGAQFEQIYNDVQSGYNADRILYYAGRPYLTSTGQQVQGTHGYFRLLNISTLGDVKSRNDVLFVQDTWRPVTRLTLNVGLRAEHERIPNFGDRGVKNPLEFKFGDKLAPRLGFAWDATSDGRTKVYGSFGKYFDVMKYELPRGSFGGDKWVDYFFTWDSPNWPSNGAGCATGTNTISERPTCAAGTFIEALDRRFNSAEALDEAVDPNLKPMEEKEYQLGITRELGWNNVVVGARYIQKDMVRTIEDVGILVPGIGEVFYIANPGEGISLTLAGEPGIPDFPKAVREYKGLELTLERRFANNWSAYASYTYSRLYGNYSGLASSDENGRTSPNVNRFFDHIENTFDRNGEAVFGRLGTDRPHQFKTQLLYRTNFDLTIGVNQRLTSGLPVSEEGLVAANVPFFPYGRGNLGRTPVVAQTDLSLFQDFRVGGRFNVQVGLTVLNVFDSQTVTSRANGRVAGSLPLTTSAFFAGGWDYEAVVAANPQISNFLFNQPNAYLAPREVRLSAKIRF